MKDFGLFLCNLRTSAGLSLEELAKLVGQKYPFDKSMGIQH